MSHTAFIYLPDVATARSQKGSGDHVGRKGASIVRLEIRSPRLRLGETMRAYVERRMRFALGRMASTLGQVVVRLADVNGPRGGEDKRCRVSLAVRPHTRIIVEEVDHDLYAAIDRAAGRAGRIAARAVGRRRRWAPRPALT
jgi:ribosome-associated translation inhibitor RaiA